MYREKSFGKEKDGGVVQPLFGFLWIAGERSESDEVLNGRCTHWAAAVGTC